MRLHTLIDRLLVMQNKYGNPEVVVLDPTGVSPEEGMSVWTDEFKIGRADATTNNGAPASVLTIVPRPDLLPMDSELRKTLDDA